MNTASNTVPESAAGDRHRLSTRDAAVLLVGASGTVGEPFDLHRAADRCRGRVVRFPRQHDWAAGTSPRCFAARSCKSASCNRSAVRHRGNHVDFDCVHCRCFLLSRRAVRRTPRSQHFVLEIAAGFRSHHLAFEGDNSVRRSAAGYFRDHRGDAVCHAALDQRCFSSVMA